MRDKEKRESKERVSGREENMHVSYLPTHMGVREVSDTEARIGTIIGGPVGAGIASGIVGAFGAYTGDNHIEGHQSSNRDEAAYEIEAIAHNEGAGTYDDKGSNFIGGHQFSSRDEAAHEAELIAGRARKK